MEAVAVASIFVAAILGFFGTIWYGLFVLSKAISGRFYRSKELEALQAEVARMRQELSATLLGQDDEVQRLARRVNAIEQALPALRAGAAAEAEAARARLHGP